VNSTCDLIAESLRSFRFFRAAGASPAVYPSPGSPRLIVR